MLWKRVEPSVHPLQLTVMIGGERIPTI